MTGKAQNGISPHGTGILFSDIYLGSVSDSVLTEKSAVSELIMPEHELMAYRGFSVQEHCAIKVVFSNPPAQKNSDQFCNSDVAADFDITSCRIHVERFIGRVRD